MNKQWKTLENAPITEAVFDLRVSFEQKPDLSAFELFHDKIKEIFPKKKKRLPWKAEIQIQKNAMRSDIVAPTEPDGYLFHSDDNKKIVQARIDGFTFNKLKPYTAWSDFYHEAISYWKLYIDVANPKAVTRLALRYINRIEIPLPIKDFKEYLRTVPEIGPQIPQELPFYFMQLVVPRPDLPATAIITQTLDTSKESMCGVIFDIDVFTEKILDPMSKELPTIFNSLRDFKNQIFFGSITERTAELLKCQE